eukprot:4646426-Amphidinium_carterae.2
MDFTHLMDRDVDPKFRFDRRGITGLDRAVSKYAAMLDKRMLHMRLKQLHNLVVLLRKFTDSNILTMASAEFNGVVEQMKKEGVVVPLCIAKDLLHKRCQSLLAEHNVKALLSVMNPFQAQSVFAVDQPTLGAIPSDPASKLVTFESFILEEYLVDHLTQGEDSLPIVRNLSYAGLDLCDKTDLIEDLADEGMHKRFHDHQTVWKALATLCCEDNCYDFQDLKQSTLCKFYVVVSALGANCEQDEVHDLKKSTEKRGKTALHLVAASMENIPFWKQRLTDYLTEAPAIAEWKPVMTKHMEALASVAADEEGLQLLQVAAGDLRSMSAVLREQAYDTFKKALAEKVAEMSGTILGKPAIDPNGGGLASKVQPMVLEMSFIEPMNEVWQGLMTQLGVHQQQFQRTSASQDFMNAANAWIAKVRTIAKDTVADLCEELKALGALGTATTSFSTDL